MKVKEKRLQGKRGSAELGRKQRKEGGIGNDNEAFSGLGAIVDYSTARSGKDGNFVSVKITIYDRRAARDSLAGFY